MQIRQRPIVGWSSGIAFLLLHHWSFILKYIIYYNKRIMFTYLSYIWIVSGIQLPRLKIKSKSWTDFINESTIIINDVIIYFLNGKIQL